MTQLILQNVTKRFQHTHAVDHVDLSVPDGKLVCFLGPSGCGKTTLMRIIAGLERPTAGTITFAGRDLTHVPANRRDFGMVFQSLALFPHMSVAQNIAYPLRLRKTAKAAQARRVAELLELIQLPHMADRLVTQLSGGQRQRVAIARALVQNPEIILADEPIASLDPRNTKIVMDALLRINKHFGITVICNLHSLDLARSYCDRLIGMATGRVVFDDVPAALTAQIARELYDLEADEVMGAAHPAPAATVPALGEAAVA